VPPGTATRAADELLAAVAAALPAGARRDVDGAGRPGPEQLRLQKLLQKRLGEIAAELAIQPEVLATRRELVALARGERDVPALRGWRREIVGERLLAAML
jgi:ribonuclease D